MALNQEHTEPENDAFDNEEEHSWLPRTPSASSVIGLNFSTYFDKVNAKREDALLNGLTLLDTVDTFFDARIDLFERQLKKQRERIQTRATLLAKERREKLRTSAEEYDRELQKFKLKVSARLNRVTEAWQTSRVIRTREKLVFFLAVMNVFGTALLFGLAPQWIHISYTVQVLYLLPLRFVQYKAKGWAYFLADLCYFANVLTLIFLWLAPGSEQLFMATYCLTHGSLATAVITWRNSLVFHDHDKMVSLFIHIYPPLVLTVARHFYPNTGTRFPALEVLPTLHPMQALVWSALFYLLWQGLYWRLLLVRRREKIKSGQRTTSFSYMLQDKHGPIGKMLRAVNPDWAEFYFMLGQFGYSIVTELPAIFVLYNSPGWSMAFIGLIFAASAWNGGGYYIEVFGRKFERELDSLRKELANAQSASQMNSRPLSDTATSPSQGDSSLSSPFPSLPNSPQMNPEVVITEPEILMDESSAKKRTHSVSASDVVSIDSDSVSATPVDVHVDENEGGLGLFDEERKNQ